MGKDKSFWVAKDKNGVLCLFYRDKSVAAYFEIKKDHPIGKDLTWEDEPREIELVKKGTLEAFNKMCSICEHDDCTPCPIKEFVEIK